MRDDVKAEALAAREATGEDPESIAALLPGCVNETESLLKTRDQRRTL